MEMAKAINKEINRKREDWVDILRALAIFLVIVGHIYKSQTFYQIVNPIKMPLFYFLSGMFIGLNKDFSTFIKGMAYRLILPWIVFSLFPLYLLKYLVRGDIEMAISYARDFFLGYDVWFIPSFIIAQIICYVLFHLFKKNELFILVACVICFCLGVALRNVAVFNAWKAFF